MYDTPTDNNSFIDQEKYDLFEKKIKDLLNESNYSYKKRTVNYRKELMFVGKDKKESTHEIIKNYVENVLLENLKLVRKKTNGKRESNFFWKRKL